MGTPWLGASASRMFRGMTVENTFPGKCRRTSWDTCAEKFVRPSNMVSATPKTSSRGFIRRFTVRSVAIRSLSPSSAKYSHCTGTKIPSAAHRAFSVSSSNDGGQSTKIKS